MDLARFDNSNFDRGAPLWLEGLWFLFRGGFFLLPLPIPSSFRVMVLRSFGAKVGQGVVIRSRVWVTFPWKLEVGDHVWLGEEVLLHNLDTIQIGSNCCVSQRAFLCTGSHNHRKQTFDLITRPIVLKDSTWVAAQVFVGPGVTVGERSFLTGGAVVYKNVPEGRIYSGNPAQDVGERVEQ